jgi:hypothetical protein
MNKKILEQLSIMFQASPHLMRNNDLLSKAISGTFGVELETEFTDIISLADQIHHAVLEQYFSTVWQPQTKKYKYSGLSIVDEVNALSPSNVLDLGCGYNEFKGKIKNLIGVDPYNKKADIKSKLLDHSSDHLYDVVICLGSINFGSVDKIYNELEHAVKLTKQGGLLYFRANPGRQHEAIEAKWIEFFNWNSEFIINSADKLNCEVVELRQEMGERGSRYYFVFKKN